MIPYPLPLSPFYPKVSAFPCLLPPTSRRKDSDSHIPYLPSSFLVCGFLRSVSMDDDWDLYAIVRGCANSSSSAATSATGAGYTAGSFDNTGDSCTAHRFSSFSGRELVSGSLFSTPDPFETRNDTVVEDLHELYKPFFPKSYQSTTSLYPLNGGRLSPVIVSQDQAQIKQQQQPKLSQTGSVISTANSHTPRSKRRKNQLKKICQVPAEALSSDVWAWRKYGQKPIKGSPYPRGYYRCSSSKGCLARKQVERNRSDPGMFIVTYTGEHNHPAPTHRNSLAGSTRQKTTTTPQAPTTGEPNQASPAKPTCSSSSPTTSQDDEILPQSTNTESREEKDTIEDDEEEDEFGGFSDNMAVSDDFFSGLEEFAMPATGDRFSDHFTMNFGLPWMVNNATTAAGSL